MALSFTETTDALIYKSLTPVIGRFFFVFLGASTLLLPYVFTRHIDQALPITPDKIVGLLIILSVIAFSLYFISVCFTAALFAPSAKLVFDIKTGRITYTTFAPAKKKREEEYGLTDIANIEVIEESSSHDFTSFAIKISFFSREAITTGNFNTRMDAVERMNQICRIIGYTQ